MMALTTLECGYRTRHQRLVRRAVFACVLCGLASCDDSSGPSDFIPPELEVISPSADTYDLDGDGLIDVEVMFADDGSGIDPATIRLTANGRDLLAEWQVTQRDAPGLAVEETLEGLLSAGSTVLSLTVSDRAGNEQRAIIALELPAGTLHQSITLPFDPVRRVQDLVMRPDGEILFAVDETSELLVVEPNEYRLLAQPSGPLNDLQGLAFDASRNRVYAVSFLHPGLAEFDGTTGDFLRLIPTTEGAFTLALSGLTSEIYIPLEVEFQPASGFLSVVDRDNGEELAVINSGVENKANPGTVLGQHAAILTADEDRLYVPTASEGLLVYGPHDRVFTQQIDLLTNDERLGSALAAERVGTDLFVNVLRDFNFGSAVYHLDAANGRIVRIKSLGPETDINTGAAASPDGTRLFVAGSSGSRINNGPANYLLSLPTLSILSPLEGAEGVPETFGYNGVTWHPDGKRVYVAASDFVGGRNEILVYLVRP